MHAVFKELCLYDTVLKHKKLHSTPTNSLCDEQYGSTVRQETLAADNELLVLYQFYFLATNFFNLSLQFWNQLVTISLVRPLFTPL